MTKEHKENLIFLRDYLGDNIDVIDTELCEDILDALETKTTQKDIDRNINRTSKLVKRIKNED